MVIIIDAVNQLVNPSDHNLWWLPSFLPERIDVAISSLSGPVIDEASVQGWPQLSIPPLNDEEKTKLVEARLKLYGKTLPKDQVEKLVSHSLSSNPLFLTTVMQELCTLQ